MLNFGDDLLETAVLRINGGIAISTVITRSIHGSLRHVCTEYDMTKLTRNCLWTVKQDQFVLVVCRNVLDS